MTEIYIISGFLGAGKTTLIQKLLTEAFQDKKIALVENDFGEVSVDAALLKGGGYQVRELNTGCICCTLTGDFIAALNALLKSYHPEVVLIEPSGVGKLSDVEKACQAISQARIQGKMTVVDVKRCQSYLENFGEFFEDQVIHADTVLFSRTASFPDRISEAVEVVRTLNPHAVLFTEEWETIPALRLLGEKISDECPSHWEECCNHQNHSEECCDHSGHHHTATEAFDTLTLRFQETVSLPAIAARLTALEASEYGTVLRAKGILRCKEGFCNLQFLPGDLKLERTHVSGNELCIIGKGLKEAQIVALFADA